MVSCLEDVPAGYQFIHGLPLFLKQGYFVCKGGENNILDYQLIILFGLNCISAGLSTMKTIFLSNRVIAPVYVTTFLDAVLFAYAFRLVSTSSSLLYVLAFALGKIAGVSVGNFIEEKLAVGLLEVTVYKHPEEGKFVADRLRDKGYSVTTAIGYGLQGKERLIISIVIPRKNLPNLRASLEKYGHVNMFVKTVTDTSGKVGHIHIPHTKPRVLSLMKTP